MKKNKISGIILTKNEGSQIERCVKSMLFCDEIIFLDDCSDNDTESLLKKLVGKYRKCRIVERKLEGDFAAQRNYGMSQADGDWVLYIDADEEVAPELEKEIRDVLENPSYSAFYIKRRDIWWGKELKHGEVARARNYGIVRLIRKNSGKWLGNVHEVFYTAQVQGRLRSYLNHFPHPALKEFIQDINVYSDMRAKELYTRGKKFRLGELVFFPVFKFLLTYLLYLGFLDGPQGFVYAFLMSFHSFLVRAKLCQYEFKGRNP